MPDLVEACGDGAGDDSGVAPAIMMAAPISASSPISVLARSGSRHRFPPWPRRPRTGLTPPNLRGTAASCSGLAARVSARMFTCSPPISTSLPPVAGVLGDAIGEAPHGHSHLC